MSEIKTLEELKKFVKELNFNLRRENITESMSGDELNDFWEEKILKKIKDLEENKDE